MDQSKFTRSIAEKGIEENDSRTNKLESRITMLGAGDSFITMSRLHAGGGNSKRDTVLSLVYESDKFHATITSNVFSLISLKKCRHELETKIETLSSLSPLNGSR